MGLNVPKQPPPRDFDIYYAVISHQRKQREVAVEHDISQGRVSQIVRQVEQWIINMRPSRQCKREIDNLYLAVDAQVERLRSWERLARDGFAISCQPAGEKPAKPDPRFIQHGVATAEKLHEMEVREVKTREEMKQSFACGVCDEDVAVEVCLNECRRVVEHAGTLQALGVEVQVPTLDEAQVERHIRNHKRAGSKRFFPLGKYLPSEWQLAVQQVFDLPFDPTSVPTPPPAAPAEPPPAPIVKSKHRYEYGPLPGTPIHPAELATWDEEPWPGEPEGDERWDTTSADESDEGDQSLINSDLATSAEAETPPREPEKGLINFEDAKAAIPAVDTPIVEAEIGEAPIVDAPPPSAPSAKPAKKAWKPPPFDTTPVRFDMYAKIRERQEAAEAARNKAATTGRGVPGANAGVTNVRKG